jgi:hypothetical protein
VTSATNLTGAERIALRSCAEGLNDGIRDMLQFAKTAADVDAQIPRLRALASIMRALEDDELAIDDDLVGVVAEERRQTLLMIEDHRDHLSRLAQGDRGSLFLGEDFAESEASSRAELDGLLDEYAGCTSVLQRAGVA